MNLSTSESLDPRSTPHGHTEASAPREKRILARVTIRPSQMSLMLADGRAYGPGEHTIQCYASDFAGMQTLLETREDLVLEAERVAAEKVLEWCAKHRATPAECPINVPAEFRALVRNRDMGPITRIEIVGELDEIRVEAERAQLERQRSTQTTPSELASALVGALQTAGLVAAPKSGK